MPNSLAASQVLLNLNTNVTAAPIAINIQLGRDADWEAARQLALIVAGETLGEKNSAGCFVTKVEPSSVTLQLSAATPDPVHRDALRSTLLTALAQRFAAAKLGHDGSASPSFS